MNNRDSPYNVLLRDAIVILLIHPLRQLSSLFIVAVAYTKRRSRDISLNNFIRNAVELLTITLQQNL